MEIRHKKNTAYYLSFPMLDSTAPETFKTGLTVTDTAYYKDGAGAWTSLAIADTVAEIGSTGMYQIDLTAEELNHDQVIIKMTSAGAADSAVLFKLDANAIDDLALQSSVSNLANVGSAVHKSALSYTLTTGTQSSGTYTSTEALDGTAHEHTDTAGALDLYYEFQIGGGSPSSAQVTGYVTGANDSIGVYGYDWVAASWKQIGTMVGSNLAVNQVNSFDLFVDMVGSGADEGKVRIRFYEASGLTSATISIDQIFVAFNQGVEGYDNGAVWFNSNITNTGTEPNIDGTARNPVSTSAALLTLLASTNLNKVEMAPGSTLTLSGAMEGYTVNGNGGVLALGGQNIGGSVFERFASVTGTGTTTANAAFFEDCIFGTATIPPAVMQQCGYKGTVTVGSAGDLTVIDGYSNVAGAGSPIFTKTAGQAVTIQYRRWSGGITQSGLESGDVVTIGGGDMGTITLNGANASVELRGIAKALTNNLTGSPTVNNDLLIADSLASVDAILDEPLSGHNVANSLGRAIRQINEGVIAIEGTVNDAGATVNTFITDLTEASDSHYSDLTLAFIDGNLKGQSKPILSYNGTTKTVVLDEDLTEAPGNGDGFIILTTHVHPVAQIADAVFDEATAGHVTAGSFGKLFSDMLADTNELQTDIADGGRVDLLLDGIAALNDLSGADVLAQVNAALDTAIAELGVGTPTATPTLRTGLMLLYMSLRNQVSVDTTGADAMKIHNDAGTQIASKLVTDDGTDYTEAKMT